MLSMAAAVISIALLSATPTTSDCYSNSTWSGACVSNSGEQVDIVASQTQPGTTPDNGDAADPAQPPPADCLINDYRCSYSVATLPDVTSDDLASFRPASPTLIGEPAGVAVVGMPANFVATASEQHIAGELLGWDVVVRFVPEAYVFDYGDGSSRRSATGGATWESLGQAQFTPTSTSHSYSARGTYSASVTLEYSASVDFGTGAWRPVAGYVTASTGGYTVRVVEVRTALVDKTCLERPSGPGC